MNKSVLKALVGTFFTLSLLASCGSKYNKTKFKDPNEGSERIYGNKGGEPLHISNPSAPDPAVGAISKPAAPKFREQIEATLQK